MIKWMNYERNFGGEGTLIFVPLKSNAQMNQGIVNSLKAIKEHGMDVKDGAQEIWIEKIKYIWQTIEEKQKQKKPPDLELTKCWYNSDVLTEK